jgi:hypothetical protein
MSSPRKDRRRHLLRLGAATRVSVATLVRASAPKAFAGDRRLGAGRRARTENVSNGVTSQPHAAFADCTRGVEVFRDP